MTRRLPNFMSCLPATTSSWNEDTGFRSPPPRAVSQQEHGHSINSSISSIAHCGSRRRTEQCKHRHGHESFRPQACETTLRSNKADMPALLGLCATHVHGRCTSSPNCSNWLKPAVRPRTKSRRHCIRRSFMAQRLDAHGAIH